MQPPTPMSLLFHPQKLLVLHPTLTQIWHSSLFSVPPLAPSKLLFYLLPVAAIPLHNILHTYTLPPLQTILSRVTWLIFMKENTSPPGSKSFPLVYSCIPKVQWPSQHKVVSSLFFQCNFSFLFLFPTPTTPLCSYLFILFVCFVLFYSYSTWSS